MSTLIKEPYKLILKSPLKKLRKKFIGQIIYLIVSIPIWIGAIIYFESVYVAFIAVVMIGINIYKIFNLKSKIRTATSNKEIEISVSETEVLIPPIFSSNSIDKVNKSEINRCVIEEIERRDQNDNTQLLIEIQTENGIEEIRIGLSWFPDGLDQMKELETNINKN